MKAILKNGLFHLKGQVPTDWAEGTELDVEKAPGVEAGDEADELDRWFADLEAACAQMDAEDERILKWLRCLPDQKKR